MTDTPSHGTPETALRFGVEDLLSATTALFQHAGLDTEKAGTVASALLDADTMGHATHGLALVPWYLEAIRSGSMACSGDIEVVSDRGACIAWKGQRLPGAWLIHRAIDLALARVAAHGSWRARASGSSALGRWTPRARPRTTRRR